MMLVVLDGVDEVEDGDAGGLQLRQVGDDVELGNLAALHGDGADAGDAIERRLAGRRSRAPRAAVCETAIGGEAVAEDGEGGEGEAVGGDHRGGRERLLHAWLRAASTSCRVWNMSTFQSKKRLTSAEPRLVVERTVDEAGDAVDGVFDGLGDGDLHLLDGHDAVVDADDDAREIGLGEDGDGCCGRARRRRRW